VRQAAGRFSALRKVRFPDSVTATFRFVPLPLTIPPGAKDCRHTHSRRVLLRATCCCGARATRSATCVLPEAAKGGSEGGVARARGTEVPRPDGGAPAAASVLPGHVADRAPWIVHLPTLTIRRAGARVKISDKSRLSAGNLPVSLRPKLASPVPTVARAGRAWRDPIGDHRSIAAGRGQGLSPGAISIRFGRVPCMCRPSPRAADACPAVLSPVPKRNGRCGSPVRATYRVHRGPFRLRIFFVIDINVT
jgi:hypothetical protein